MGLSRKLLIFLVIFVLWSQALYSENKHAYKKHVQRYIQSSDRAEKFFFKNLPYHLASDFKESFFNRRGFLFLGSLALTASLHPLDDNFNIRHSQYQWFGETGNNIISWSISPYSIGAFSLGALVYAKKTDRKKLASAMEASLETWFLTQSISMAGKLISRRRRPDGSRFSLPSAHASAAFGFSTVLYKYYGPKVGIPAYTLSVLTSLSRFDSKKHWVTDLLAGASLGIFIGWGTANFHKKKKQQWVILPWNDGDRLGVQFGKSF